MGQPPALQHGAGLAFSVAALAATALLLASRMARSPARAPRACRREVLCSVVSSGKARRCPVRRVLQVRHHKCDSKLPTVLFLWLTLQPLRSSAIVHVNGGRWCKVMRGTRPGAGRRLGAAGRAGADHPRAHRADRQWLARAGRLLHARARRPAGTGPALFLSYLYPIACFRLLPMAWQRVLPV